MTHNDVVLIVFSVVILVVVLGAGYIAHRQGINLKK